MGKDKIKRSEIDFSWIKRFYKNGSLKILGSKNIYAIWNRILFLIYKFFQTKFGKNK